MVCAVTQNKISWVEKPASPSLTWGHCITSYIIAQGLSSLVIYIHFKYKIYIETLQWEYRTTTQNESLLDKLFVETPAIVYKHLVDGNPTSISGLLPSPSPPVQSHCSSIQQGGIWCTGDQRNHSLLGAPSTVGPLTLFHLLISFAGK